MCAAALLPAFCPRQVSEILDQWIQLQRQWMYLEPIFGSEDIMQQLPLEGKRFATVDRLWRKTTEAAKRNPLVLKVGRERAHACVGQGCMVHGLHGTGAHIVQWLATRLRQTRF